MMGERAESDPMPRRGGGGGAAKNGRRERGGVGARIAGFAVSAFLSFGFEATTGRGGPGDRKRGDTHRRGRPVGRVGAPRTKEGVKGVKGWVEESDG